MPQIKKEIKNMSFASMKKNTMSFEELSNKLEDAGGGSKGKSYNDERQWYPKLDDQKNGYAVIRFLPTSDKDVDANGEPLVPFAKLYSHGFKGETGQWYFENCPTTLDNDCPVCQANRAIVESHGGWDTTPKSAKDGPIRNRKRKLSYYSNIYVVSDPETPENEGKVFLFKYGKKIFDQLMEAIKPSFPDKTPIKPFDMWKGANYKLKIRQVENQTNYDSSEFEAMSQFLPTNEEMEAVYNQQYTLKDLNAPDKFKEFVDLEKRFNRVEGGEKSTTTAETIDEKSTATEKSVAAKPQFKEKEAEPTKVEEAPKEVDDNGFSEDDDAMNYFASLAED